MAQVLWDAAMALAQINIRGDAVEGLEHLHRQVSALRKGASVTFMTHGYRFCPDHPERSPHRHILSMENTACWKAVSWPRHLHLNRPEAGLGVAVGWSALASLPRTAARAFEVGSALASLINKLHDTRPDLRMHLLAHSLGARVALSAMSKAHAGAVQRVILMSGAEYQSVARAAMASPAGRQTAVLNVSSRENALFDGLFRLCAPAPIWFDPTLSAGLGEVSNWTNLRADCPDHRAALRRLGIRTTAPTTSVCHWSTYLRPGLFKLYRKVLDPAQRDFLLRLRAELPASGRPAAIAPLPAPAAGPRLIV